MKKSVLYYLKYPDHKAYHWLGLVQMADMSTRRLLRRRLNDPQSQHTHRPRPLGYKQPHHQLDAL